MKAVLTVEQMLNRSQKIDFLKAVWQVESAADPSLSWQEFSRSEAYSWNNVIERKGYKNNFEDQMLHSGQRKPGL